MSYALRTTCAISNPFTFAVVVIAGLACLIWLLVTAKFGKLWLQAKLSGVNVTLIELIGMTLRKVNTETLVISYIAAIRAGLELRLQDLEAHYLAGGSVPQVVRALIAAERKNVQLSFTTATSADLAGYDILTGIQDCPEGAKIHSLNTLKKKENFDDTGDKDDISALRT